MTTTTSARRRVGLALAAPTAVLALLAAPPTLAGASDAGPSTSPATGSAADSRAESRAERTRVTFRVANCEGCEFRLYQGHETDDPQQPAVWLSREKKVRDGAVSWRIPTARTEGMSATVVAPWEGHTGYLTTVAFRYGREEVGSRVNLEKAQGKSMGSACFAGTDADRFTRVVRVRRVPVEGVHERVLGSIAFTARTQPWTAPMRRVWGGVLGSQEVNLCGAG